jgi:RNAse (barnase) inhibitor barstar
VRLSELKGLRTDTYFTEDVIDRLIDVYTIELKAPYELIFKTVERSRDRFQREFSRLESHFEQAKFFTEEGVKERKEKLKLKVLMN